ncbi:hypothetical protein L1987_81735 [Smallanthus sonchifolius]|uniref:Uncharacterized protein n=1 Tax=Smallanthus sonchifolius TaxID=185202 RepID=A0ACB8YSV5_9ASTR|nr:hypothetical protein L1987_81735 [Smallanthus sonchifolius]
MDKKKGCGLHSSYKLKVSFCNFWKLENQSTLFRLLFPSLSPTMAIPATSFLLFAAVITLTTKAYLAESSSNNNHVFSPCADAMVESSDGFTFGIAFAARTAFFYNKSVQLSPCDRRLSLSSANSQLSVFRPKVDETSLLTVNSSSFSPDSYGGYMVAFAGRKYAARSIPAFVANGTYTVTSFTLVLEFQKDMKM